jgi:hypothetical protein
VKYSSRDSGTGNDDDADGDGWSCLYHFPAPSHPNPIKNSTQDSCCALCNTDSACTFWVLDPGAHLCYLLQNVQKRNPTPNRISGGATLPGPPTIQFHLHRDPTARFYGGGGAAGSPLLKTSSHPYVTNTAFQSPQYWSSDGYGALGVAPYLFTPHADPSQYPASWYAAVPARPIRHVPVFKCMSLTTQLKFRQHNFRLIDRIA